MILPLLFTCLLSGLTAIVENDEEIPHEMHETNEEDPAEENESGDAHLEGDSESDDVKSCKKCGFINSNSSSTMVVKGSEVDPPNKYPWMVSLNHKGQKYCGGAIIDEYHILTAAHCLRKDTVKGSSSGSKKGEDNEYVEPSDITVKFLTEEEDLAKGPEIAKIIPHKEFDMKNLKHDFGLIKLKSKLTCSKLRNPICLPTDNHNLETGKELKIAGWGADEEGSTEPVETLLEAKIKIVDYSVCKNSFPKGLEDHYYCLKGMKKQTPCMGDSGGPAFAELSDKYYVFGISSTHSSTECEQDKPFIYTSVSKHIKWINTNKKQQSSSKSLSANTAQLSRPAPSDDSSMDTSSLRQMHACSKQEPCDIMNPQEKNFQDEENFQEKKSRSRGRKKSSSSRSSRKKMSPSSGSRKRTKC